MSPDNYLRGKCGAAIILLHSPYDPTIPHPTQKLTRHISFLESGRAKPSKDMVHQLARSLKMPKPDTNQALLAAGFAPAFQLHRPDSQDVAQINLAVETILQNHMPLPAIVLDRHWNITAWNGAGKMLLRVVGFVEGGNLVELTLSPHMRQIVENWDEVIVLLLHRLEVEYCDSGGDVILGALLEKLRIRIRAFRLLFGSSDNAIPI